MESNDSQVPTVARLQDRANYLASINVFVGGPVEDFERIGRLQLEVLIHEGVYPTSNVLDLGCGCLRGGYWLMHLLEPGHYFGIEPWEECLQAGLDHIAEPELVERAKPSFARNDDFDFSVFGQSFDFVVARSVWTHASKDEIERMLDSFVRSGSQGSVFLASYLPASPFPAVLTKQIVGLVGRSPGLFSAARRLIPGPWERPDHGGSWSSEVIGHRRSWIQKVCRRRGLTVRQLEYGVANGQVWLRIDHPLPSGATA